MCFQWWSLRTACANLPSFAIINRSSVKHHILINSQVTAFIFDFLSANMGFHLLSILICIQSFHNFLAANDIQQRDELKTFIVHVQPPYAQNFTRSPDLESWYHSFLPEISLSSRMIYAYNNVLSGFAARLSIDEVKEMDKKPGFISALLEQVISLQTTHTPKLLGLNQTMGL